MSAKLGWHTIITHVDVVLANVAAADAADVVAWVTRDVPSFSPPVALAVVAVPAKHKEILSIFRCI